MFAVPMLLKETLEDWFDPRRLRDDYVPTGYKPYGVKTHAVKGHEFGLQLTPEDKRALIAFLKRYEELRELTPDRILRPVSALAC